MRQKNQSCEIKLFLLVFKSFLRFQSLGKTPTTVAVAVLASAYLGTLTSDILLDVQEFDTIFFVLHCSR